MSDQPSRSALRRDVDGVLAAARTCCAGTPAAARVEEIADRLGEPLRVAIAGRVKAGKSTLLNALVGERLAATDARECTRVVTWYRNGIGYRATIHTIDGRTVGATIHRDGTSIDVDLGPLTAGQVERLVVDWPAAPLRTVTLVDTPGIASVRTEVSSRTRRFLLPGEEDEPPAPADAVVYLLRHLHGADADFLESFRDGSMGQATPVDAVGVLSRADEVGGGRLDAMDGARRVARRYGADPQVRRLCQPVVAVAGLVAQAAVTLRQDEYRALAALAAEPAGATEPALLAVGRFRSAERLGGLLPEERQLLLERLGLFGIRLAVDTVRRGDAPTAARLAAALAVESGLTELRSVLETQFTARADALTCRSALRAVARLLGTEDLPGAAVLRQRVEEVLASAHVLEELRILAALRSGTVDLGSPDATAEAQRLLGAEGTGVADRLHLDPEVDPGTARARIVGAAERWQARAQHPLAGPATVHACQVLVRTCEGLLVELDERRAAAGATGVVGGPT